MCWLRDRRSIYLGMEMLGHPSQIIDPGNEDLRIWSCETGCMRHSRSVLLRMYGYKSDWRAVRVSGRLIEDRFPPGEKLFISS